MKNIWSIFRQDVKRCYKNVIALIVVLGIVTAKVINTIFKEKDY